jgi:hypothetical protein
MLATSTMCGPQARAEEPESSTAQTIAPTPTVERDTRKFETWFPRFESGYRIGDFSFYQKLMRDDFVSFVTSVDDAVREELDDLGEKQFQIEKVHQRLRNDNDLVKLFGAFKQRLASAVVYYVSDDDNEFPSVKYVGKEFRLIVSNPGLGGERAALALIAPHYGNVQYPNEGDEITVGTWARVACWEDENWTKACGVRLRDMPAGMKDGIEDQFGKSINVRWRWRGFPTAIRTRYVDMRGG